MAKLITLRSKTEFLHCLIHEEVVGKCLKAISAFKKGLSILSIDDVLRKFKDNMRSLFIHDPSQILTAERLIDLIEWGETSEITKHTKVLFIQYLKGKSGKLIKLSPLLCYNYCKFCRISTAKEILSFWTGLDSIPPLGLSEPLHVEYQPMETRFCLPIANACFNKLKLPTIHTDKHIFNLKIDQGISLSLSHFGLL